PQAARVWIPDHAEVWRAAEITGGYKEGDAILHLCLEGGSARLELCSPVGPSCAPHLPPLCSPDCLSGASDLVALSHPHEPPVPHL
ncbi:MYO5C protein, partial [Callaeas wilsoni]|nr:MYO5C protein [Callaeas wilsoni]